MSLMDASVRRWCGAIVLAATASMLAREQTSWRPTVHVVSFDTGRPIPAARVTIGEEHSDAFHNGTTDAKGIVTYSSPSPSGYRRFL
jgi:hypothetical protein